MRGETRFDLPRSGSFALVTEDVDLDPQGRLTRAVVHVAWHGLNAPEVDLSPSSELTSFDAQAGLYTSRGDSGRTQTRRIALDLPWSYLPLATPEGEILSTPVAVIVARHAAQISATVRQIDPFGHDLSVTSDQILVADGREDLVVLGDDLASFARGKAGRADLVRLHLAALDLNLNLRQTAPEPL